MKKIFTLSFIFLFAITSFAATTKKKKSSKSKKTETTKVHFASEADDDSRLQAEWELERLCDPATGKIPDNMREKELMFAATLPSDASSSVFRTAQSTTWNSRGPFNHGGRTRALAYDINDENSLFAGTVSGGMWHSANGGNSWAKVTALNVNQSVTCITQDKRVGHRNVWYYGSGEPTGTSASGGSALHLGSGIFKSTNGGLTWAKLSSTGANTPNWFDSVWDLIWNVVTDSSNATQDEVYAATYGAIFRSINGGASWTKVRGLVNDTAFSYYTDVAVTRSGVVYATLSTDTGASNQGIWRSVNGTAWTNISPSFMDTANRMVIGIDPNNENRIYILAETPGSGKTTFNYAGKAEQNSLWKYTYVSGNGSGTGGVWQDLSVNLPNSGGPFDKFNSQGGYDLVVRVKPTDSNTVIIGGTNLFRSTDAFTSPNNTTQIGGYGIGTTIPFYTVYPNHHPDQHAVLFSNNNPNVLYSGCDGGIFKTTADTATPMVWNSMNNGYLSTQFYTLAIDPATANDSVIIGGCQDNGTLYTNSQSATFNWTQPSLGDGSYCAIADGGTNYYYSRQEGKIIKTTMGTNGYVNAFARIDPLMADTTKYDFIAPFILDPNNNNIMYLTCGDMIYRNNDLSQIPLDGTYLRTNISWDSLSMTYDSAKNITAIAASKIPANRVYYGTNKGKIYRLDNANVGNPTPVNISSTAFPATAYVSCIAIDPEDADKVLIVFSNYNIYSLYYTSNGGTTWTKTAGNLEANSSGTGIGSSLRWASIMHLDSGKVVYFVASSTGLYATDTLKGTTTVWAQQGANTIGSVVSDVIVTRPSDGLVALGTHGNGVYSANITNPNQITTIHTNDKQKLDASLKNYPNPFTNSTTIEFVIQKKSLVTLRILNELGEDVKTIFTKNMEAGKYFETVDRKGLAAGVYYYQLQSGEQKITKQMVVN